MESHNAIKLLCIFVFIYVCVRGCVCLNVCMCIKACVGTVILSNIGKEVLRDRRGSPGG